MAHVPLPAPPVQSCSLHSYFECAAYFEHILDFERVAECRIEHWNAVPERLCAIYRALYALKYVQNDK